MSKANVPAWVSRMEKATDSAGHADVKTGYSCSGFEANAIAREWRRQRQMIDELKEVLGCLFDLQNGPPLPKYKNDWERAMINASRMLGLPQQEDRHE